MITVNTYGQKKCAFQIDTLKILTNQNLSELLAEFSKDSFRVTNNKSDIPQFIKSQLNCLANGFSIANPNQPYQATDVISQRLPKRQLVFLAQSHKMIVITYLLGGWGVSRHLVFIKFEGKKITDLWTGRCLNGMDSKEGIINYLKSTKSEDLHSNMIYF